MAGSNLRPHAYAALLMPSGLHKVIKVTPNTHISLGKFGTFPSNLIIGRPYHLTFELLDVAEGRSHSDLRIVPAQELHAETLSEEDGAIQDTRKSDDDDERFDLVGEDGQYIIRNNRLTVDDPSRQALGMEEIELLKKSMSTASGKDIIAKIMQSHSALDEKTAFSLAKYTLRKSKKYLKRFTLLPLDVNTLTQWMLQEKEPARIMEARHDILGLIASWSNVHCGDGDSRTIAPLGIPSQPHTVSDVEVERSDGNGRWLVVDETCGLLVATLAERMGLLHYDSLDPESCERDETATDIASEDHDEDDDGAHTSDQEPNGNQKPKQVRRKLLTEPMSAMSNTITLLHSATQPNLSLLSYFHFDPHISSAHPLHVHLKTLTWLQLLDPMSTPSYTSEPSFLTDDVLKAMKPSKRGNYYRKRRRWQRTVRVVDETRAGGFDGLVVAGAMEPESVLHHLVPLVRGGGQIVVYSPSIEPLTHLCDSYSSARKTAFLNLLNDFPEAKHVPSEDFPLDPRLLLAPTLQTARAKEWQVLPGRTHPMMTGRGGSEGYIFTGTRVLPADGKVEARGVYVKKRKIEKVDGIEGQGITS